MKKLVALLLTLLITVVSLSPALTEGTFDTIKKTSGDAEYMKEVMELITPDTPVESSGWPNSKGVTVCVSYLNGTIKIGAINSQGDRVCYSWEFGNNSSKFFMAWIVLLAEFEKIQNTIEGPFLIISVDDASVIDDAEDALKLASALYNQ